MKQLHESQLQYGEESCVHIVFSLSDAGSLKVTLGKIGRRRECEVLVFNELFSMGPITGLETIVGQQSRLRWILDHDEDYKRSHDSNPKHQLGNMVKTVQSISEHKTVVIWCADNAHDQTGLRFVSYLLKEREQPIYVVNVTEQYQLLGLSGQDNVIPYASGQIDRVHYLEIVRKFDEAVPITSSQRRQYETEWLALADQPHVLRLWEDGSVRGREESALDVVIIKSVMDLEHEQDENGFVKAGAVVVKVFDTSRQLIGYSFIRNRIQFLVDEGILAVSGLLGVMHQYSVKIISNRSTNS